MQQTVTSRVCCFWLDLMSPPVSTHMSHAYSRTINYYYYYCFAAIKTGRYTYEKKTKIIKEVKQLELANRATFPTQPSSDSVVALSTLPHQITDNKYELVIAQILAAYRGHPLLDVNFLADMKQKEETYLVSSFALL